MDPHHHYKSARRAGLAAPERARVIPAELAPLGAGCAAPAGLSPPRKDEPTEALAGAGGFRDQGRADSPDSAAADASEQAGAPGADAKRFATLRARLALAGWALTRNETGAGAPNYTAARWNMQRELAGLAAAEAFADRVGARE